MENVTEPGTDIVNELSYYRLYDVAERARWTMGDIPWDQIDLSVVNDSLVGLVKGCMFGELTTYSATQAFMTLFADDIDFTQWLSVWLYEETKHPHALAKWLSHVGQPVSASFFSEGRVITPMSDSRVEMLTYNIISEVVAAVNYTWTAKVMPEPVLKIILHNIGKDEMRHSQGFEHYCKMLIRASEDPDRERVRCLRSTWAFLHSDESVEHPVFITARHNEAFVDPEVIEKARAVIRTQIVRRISGVVEIDIPDSDADSVYAIYRNLKAKRRSTKRATA